MRHIEHDDVGSSFGQVKVKVSYVIASRLIQRMRAVTIIPSSRTSPVILRPTLSVILQPTLSVILQPTLSVIPSSHTSPVILRAAKRSRRI